jgi:hypothetical protein
VRRQLPEFEQVEWYAVEDVVEVSVVEFTLRVSKPDLRWETASVLLMLLYLTACTFALNWMRSPTIGAKASGMRLTPPLMVFHLLARK